MNDLRRARRPVRREFETLYLEIDRILKSEPPIDQDLLAVKAKLFIDNVDNLMVHDQKVINRMVEDNPEEADENKEHDEINEMKTRAETMRRRIEKAFPATPTIPVASSSTFGGESVRVRNFKLPELKMKKFNGDLKEWLPFWAQFKKIDEDAYMDGSDKLLHLIQLMEPGSEAYETVGGYYPTTENYPLAIAALHKKYGDEDLLLQVYVREILNLVISNAKSNDKIPLKTLYLKLDSHLRALKALKLENADPATWLYPMVESSLPESLQYHWQRSSMSQDQGKLHNGDKSRLEGLMNYLEKEVQIRQRVDVAKSFGKETTKRSAFKENNESRPHDLNLTTRNKHQRPTIASLHVGEVKECVFCDRPNHCSADCFIAKKMPYDERILILRKRGRCFRCCGKHIGKECGARNLECALCKGKHFTILCRGKSENPSSEPPNKRSKIHDNTPPINNASNFECSSSVALQTLMVKISDGDNWKIVRAFIDSGSQLSYILKETASSLRLSPTGIEKSVHALFGAHTTKEITHKKYNVNIESLTNGFNTTVEVRDQDKLCSKIPRICERTPSLRSELQEKRIRLSDQGKGTPNIELLLGADVYPCIITGDFLKLTAGPTAIQTKLGWTLLGNVKEHGSYTNTMFCVGGNANVIKGDVTYTNANILKKNILHTTSNAYIPDTNILQTITNANISQKRITKAITKDTKTALISQLWDFEILGITDPVTKRKNTEIEEIVRQEFIKTLTRTTHGNYSVGLPWREDHVPLPTNKEVVKLQLLRMSKKLIENELFDVYSNIFKQWECEGIIENVTDIPTESKTRVHYLNHRAVIKKESLTTPVRPVFNASFRVGKNPSLNDCLHKGENMIQLIAEVLLRFREKKIGFVSDIRKAFQMIGVHEGDRDVLRFLWWSDKNMENLIEYRHARVPFGANCSPFILAMVLYFHLTNLVSDQKECGLKLLERLYVDNCVGCEDTMEEYGKFRMNAVSIFNEAGMELRMWMSNTDNNIEDSNRIVPVLGLLWDRLTDELFVNVKVTPPLGKYTKRIVLSIAQQVYDPLGFISPAILPLKLMIQRLWLRKLKWDEAIPLEETNIIMRYLNEMNCLSELKVPRLATAGVTERKRWSLHTFTDASKDAFGTVIYLRVEQNAKISLRLLAAKSRVSPKNVTIPRLELMGCLIGARLANTVIHALGLEDTTKYFWTDSTCAKAWIKREDIWATFVANRTKEIRSLTKVDEWRHVPGTSNPADIASRGCYPSQLKSSIWFTGPTWLYKNCQHWPNLEENPNENDVVREIRKTPVLSISNTVIDYTNKHFTYQTRVRIIAWKRRFLHNKMIQCENIFGPLTRVDKTIQLEMFPMDVRNSLRNLEIMEDDWGILRVKTRLSYRNDLAAFKYPLLLPSDHPLVLQLIRDTHVNYCHGGIGFLMAKLRQSYWILRARRTIKRVIKKCVKCQRFSSRALIGESAPLPINRVNDAEIFEVMGVDLAGPLFLKNGSKVWIVIMTCAIYRAVNFELVTSISTVAFIKALGKFIRKFRRPAVVYCDNGTNFRGADNMFKRLDWNEIEKSDKCQQIEFKFNPVTSSWWGGWWERLIRSAKDLLKRTLGNRCVNHGELEAVIDAIAFTINERPLTYISEDINDLEPLTPALFLHPFGNVAFPEQELTEGDKLRFRITYVRRLKQELQQRFRNEYLGMLVNRKPRKSSEKLKVGDMVFVGRDDLKRISWPLARVVELLPGADGHCRLVTIKTKDGIWTRSVQRLHPLELDNHDPVRPSVREKAVVTRAGRVVKLPAKYRG